MSQTVPTRGALTSSCHGPVVLSVNRLLRVVSSQCWVFSANVRPRHALLANHIVRGAHSILPKRQVQWGLTHYTTRTARARAITPPQRLMKEIRTWPGGGLEIFNHLFNPFFFVLLFSPFTTPRTICGINSNSNQFIIRTHPPAPTCALESELTIIQILEPQVWLPQCRLCSARASCPQVT